VIIHPCLILQRKIVNKVFRSALTGVISVGMFSGLTVSPANAAITEHQNPATPISLSAVGTPTVGSVLTVTKQTYTTFTETRSGISWFRCNAATTLKNKLNEVEAATATCTQLTAADGVTSNQMATYTVTANDAGKHVTAVVSANDGVQGVNAGMPNNEGYSLANSLLIAASTSTPAGGGTTTGDGTTAGGGTNTSGGTQETGSTLPAQALAKAVPAKAKAGKSIKIAAVTNAKVATKVKVKGKGCKVVAVKDKKNKKKIASYKVTMGKKGATCTVRVTAPATATVAALNSVTKVKAS
jgi:hypothetical protein